MGGSFYDKLFHKVNLYLKGFGSNEKQLIRNNKRGFFKTDNKSLKHLSSDFLLEIFFFVFPVNHPPNTANIILGEFCDSTYINFKTHVCKFESPDYPICWFETYEKMSALRFMVTHIFRMRSR